MIANLLYNEDGRAVRVRPGQGDFGIDVILPAAEEAELWDVCQVKKYAANLNSTEKNKIVESFSRLLIGLVLPRQPCRIRYRRLPARRTSKGRRL